MAVTSDKLVLTPRKTTKLSAFLDRVAKDFRRNKYIYLMLVPVITYYAIFHYGPMYGAQIAFRDFIPTRGIWGSPIVGWENFTEFFDSIYFWRLIRNTVMINVLDVILGFPAPIILALLLNEIRFNPFKRLVQTISYMPHFISLVVVVGMVLDYFSRQGLINYLYTSMTGNDPILFMQRADLYWFIYVGSGIWQSIGWGSIIYLAALSTIDPTLYEAAVVDGANRWKQMIHITLPGIAPTIIIMLILRMGAMMNVGYEKTILLYNPMVMETADVISTYVYRKGLLDSNYSFSAAVGLFNSAINFSLLLLANALSRKVNQTSLF